MSNVNWEDQSDDEGEKGESSTAPSNERDNQSRETRDYRSYDNGPRDRDPGPARNLGRDRGGGAREPIIPPEKGPTPFVVIAGNIPFSCSIDDLGNYFADGGCNVEDVIIHESEGRPTGSAFIYFKDEESLQQSLNANGDNSLGRPIRVYTPRRPRAPRQEITSHRRQNDREKRDPYERPRPIPADTPAEREDVWSRKKTYSQPKDEIVEEKSVQSTSKPPERPKLVIQPRTIPLNEIGKPVTAANIFGEGKPRDESLIETKKKTENSDVSVKSSVDEPITAPQDQANSQKSDNQPKEKYTKEKQYYRASYRAGPTTTEAKERVSPPDSNELKPVEISAADESKKAISNYASKAKGHDSQKPAYVIEEGVEKMNQNTFISRGGRGRGRSDGRGHSGDRFRREEDNRGRGRGRGDRDERRHDDSLKYDKSTNKSSKVDHSRPARGPPKINPASDEIVDDKKAVQKPKETKPADIKSVSEIRNNNKYAGLQGSDEED